MLVMMVLIVVVIVIMVMRTTVLIADVILIGVRIGLNVERNWLTTSATCAAATTSATVRR